MNDLRKQFMAGENLGYSYKLIGRFYLAEYVGGCPFYLLKIIGRLHWLKDV